MENKIMTKAEICANWRQAKDKVQQIGILADLCCTSREEILDILISEGVVDENGNPPRLPGITDDDAPDIIRMRKNGLPWDAVGKKYGVSGPTACKWLKRFEEKKSKVNVSSKSEEKSDAVESKGKEDTKPVEAAPALSAEKQRRKRFSESIEIDKDFYRAVLEVHDLLRYLAATYPEIKMICEVEDGHVMASAEFDDLLAEYQSGGVITGYGKSDEEQG